MVSSSSAQSPGGCSVLTGPGTWLVLGLGAGQRWVEAQHGGLGVAAVGFGAADDVGEGELAVLRHRGEAKVFAAEEEQRVEQHDGRVGAQLLTVPQELLLHPRVHVACRGQRGYSEPALNGDDLRGALLTTGCDGGFEASQRDGELGGELAVESIHEDVLHTAILEQMLQTQNIWIRTTRGNRFTVSSDPN